jgi:hypothetical protein
MFLFCFECDAISRTPSHWNSASLLGIQLHIEVMVRHDVKGEIGPPMFAGEVGHMLSLCPSIYSPLVCTGRYHRAYSKIRITLYSSSMYNLPKV